MNPKTLGQLWVALQFGLLLTLARLCLMEARNSLPGFWSGGLWFAGVLLGLWTLWANRPGNFNIQSPVPMGAWCKKAPTAGYDTPCTAESCCSLRVPLLGWRT